MKSVLFITSTYPYGIGESFIEEELKHLSKKFRIDVLPTYPRGKIDNHKKTLINSISGELLNLKLFSLAYFVHLTCFTLLNFKVLCKLVNMCFCGSFDKTLRNLVLIPKAVYFYHMYMQSKNYDFIYSHWLSAPAQFSMLLNELSGIKFGVTSHRWDIVDNNNIELKVEKSSFIRVISNKSLKLFPSDVLKKFNYKLHTIYLGINCYDGKYTRVLTSKPVYNGICIASLTPVKGHTYLLRSIKALKDKGFNIKMKFLGEGVLHKELLELTSNLGLVEQVDFLGNLEHSRVTDLLSSKEVDFVCLPSLDLGNGLHEGVPVSLMEAMSFSIPCISTNTGSINELINSKVNGILVPDKDDHKLATAIELILSDSELYSMISTNALRTIESKFNSSKCNEALIEIIENSI